MNFSFSSDQQLLRNSARAFLDEHVKPAQVRLLWDDPRGESEALWKEMAQLGWLGLALPEDAGGSALGLVETAILQEELGRAACPSPYLSTVLAAMAIDRFGSPAQKSRWLPAVAGGGARATVALMERALDWSPQSIETRAEERGGKVALSGVKQFVPWAHVADVILVPALSGSTLAVYVVEASAPGVSVTPLTTLDPGTRVAQVTLDGAAVAAEAKLYVSDASRKVCGDAIQVHGGIGFTWEYDLHLYFKRAKALEPLYGDAEHHRELIVRRVAS